MPPTASPTSPLVLARRGWRTRSIRGRGPARTALALLAAWYVLALLIALGGVALAVTAIASDRGAAWAIVPAAIAILVVLNFWPRGHAYVKPGPRLRRAEQPELFAVLDDATVVAGAPAFDEVYVDSSATGHSVQRGGFFGFGGRRTLVLGVPLLQIMSVDHLKVLVAHEALRYYSPYDKFAALVERMRARLRAGLDDQAGRNWGLTSLMFQLCAGSFLRRTDQLSCDYRLATDDLTAGAIGTWQMAEMLKLTSGLPAVLDAYGRVYAGSSGPRFEEFAASAEAARMLAFARFRQAETAAATKCEPPVDERLVRLQEAARHSRPFDERPASSLVRNFEPLAARQLADRFAGKRS